MADKKSDNKKKRLIVSHTKGFYRFSKAYPSVTDENGYRDNESGKQKPLTNRQRLAVYFSLIFCFIIAFIITSVALNLSNREPEQETTAAVFADDESGFFSDSAEPGGGGAIINN